jgi:glycosyltransferase involved in cell wall biosynthesis
LKIALCAPVDIHALARFSGESSDGIAPGLGSTVTTPLITEFLLRGHHVTVYTLSRELEHEAVYRWGQLRIFVGPFRQRHLAQNYYRPEIDYLKRVITADAPSFVHAHWTYEFSLGALRSCIPTVTTIHDLPWNVLRYYCDPHRAVRLLMAYEVALRGRHFTAVSEAAASHFRRYLRPRTKIAVIPNGLPDSTFEIAAQSRRGDRNGITFATVIQGWSRLKNATEALRAFHIAKGQLRNARLTMYGIDYEEGGPAHQWANRNNLDAGVTFVGALSHHELLRRVNEEADVIVLPSLNESFSIVAAEGMALRKPIVAGESAAGVREVLGNGECGILVDVKDGHAIAQAMLRLARDGEYRNDMARKGFERASSLYRLEAVVRQYEALYLTYRGRN